MLKVQHIHFTYLKTPTIIDVSFELPKGSILSVMGESGCGKSTLLQLIYGLHDLDKGTIFWNDKEVLGPKFHLIPGMDYMKYLAQDFDLMPYISVAENVGKYLSNIDKKAKLNRIAELLEIVEMTEFAQTKAKFLSGGQMQRVALARVLALEPEVLLLDEPFSHIDTFRKNSLRRRLFNYLKDKNITTLIATHDSTDVLSFSDEVIILKAGKVVNHISPKELYNQPEDYYTASLFDDVNVLEVNGEMKLLFPHQLFLSENGELKATVTNSYFRGNIYLIEARYNNQTLFFEHAYLIEKGKLVCLKIRK